MIRCLLACSMLLLPLSLYAQSVNGIGDAPDCVAKAPPPRPIMISVKQMKAEQVQVADLKNQPVTIPSAKVEDADPFAQTPQSQTLPSQSLVAVGGCANGRCNAAQASNVVLTTGGLAIPRNGQRVAAVRTSGCSGGGCGSGGCGASRGCGGGGGCGARSGSCGGGCNRSAGRPVRVTVRGGRRGGCA